MKIEDRKGDRTTMKQKLTEREKTNRALAKQAQRVYSWIKRHNVKHVDIETEKLHSLLKKAGCKNPDIRKPCKCGICEPARAITERFITYRKGRGWERGSRR